MQSTKQNINLLFEELGIRDQQGEELGRQSDSGLELPLRNDDLGVKRFFTDLLEYFSPFLHIE